MEGGARVAAQFLVLARVSVTEMRNRPSSPAGRKCSTAGRAVDAKRREDAFAATFGEFECGGESMAPNYVV